MRRKRYGTWGGCLIVLAVLLWLAALMVFGKCVQMWWTDSGGPMGQRLQRFGLEELAQAEAGTIMRQYLLTGSLLLALGLICWIIGRHLIHRHARNIIS